MSPKRVSAKGSRRAAAASRKHSTERVNYETAPVVSPRVSIALLAIVLAAIVVYANTLSNRLVFDDLEAIPGNPLLHDPTDLSAIFGGVYRIGDRPASLYRPMTVWTLAVNERVNTLMGRPPDDPSGFHLANLLFHAAVGALLYIWLVSLRLPGAIALATALLFVVHPIHTEAVAAIVGRAEVLAALFGLLFLLLHRQRRSAIVCALAYLVALWSKESAIAFFPLAVAMDVAFRDRTQRWRFPAYGVYAATVGGWLAMRAVALAGQPLLVPFVDDPLTSATLSSRLLTIVRVQLAYLRLQLVPVGLSSDYSFNQIPLIAQAYNPFVLVGLTVLLLAVGTAWRMRKAHPAVAFAIAGYALLFAPTSGVLFPIGTIMGERLAYSPSIMFCLLLGYAGSQLGQRLEGPVAAGFIALTLVFGGLTIARNRTWADELTFFRTQVESAPDSAKAHYGFGGALANSGDDRAAISEYEKAIAIYPYYSEVFFNMGNALRRLGRDPAQVIAAYRNTIRFNPRNANARANLALFLLEHDRLEDARPEVEELARIDPHHPALAVLRLAVPAQ